MGAGSLGLGFAADAAVLGTLFAAAVAMAALLSIWDAFRKDSSRCWMCGRDELRGRKLSVVDWYEGTGTGACAECERPLVSRGDNVLDAPATR
jgi:hypothetical protein